MGKGPRQMNAEKTKANIALLAGGALFGVSSPMARLMGAWLNPLSVVFVRFLFALPFALIFFFKGERPKNLPYKKLIVFGILFPISVCLYNWSLFNTKISLAIFSFYISNVLSSILAGYFLHHEKICGNKLIGFILAFVAIVCFTDPLHGFALDRGMLFGYASGIVQTIASLRQKRLSQTVDERSMTLVQIVSGVIVAAVLCVVLKDDSVFRLTAFGLVLASVFGFMNFLINYFMIYGFKHAEIGIGTILLSSELLFGPLAAFAMFGETLSHMEILGGLLIALSVVFVARHKT